MEKLDVLNVLEQVRQNQTSKPEHNTIKKEFNPHLAICHEGNKSANNRHVSLLMKSADAIEFEQFCRSMTNSKTLLALYSFIKSSDEDELLKNIIRGTT